MVSDDHILPPQLSTSEEGSFARQTILSRKPQIIRRVLQDNAGHYPPDVIRTLEAFRQEIAQHAIIPLFEPAPDAAAWNAALSPYAGEPWLDLPWYVAEAYFYRKLLESVRYFQPGPLQKLDPFSKQKSEQTSLAVAQLASIWPTVEQLPPDERFDLLLHSALWGNRADLSNFTVTESAHKGLDAHRERANLLIDHSAAVLALFRTGPLDHVAVVTDNVGADSLFDLALADFLLAHGWVTRVTFYLKDRPFFVSDATPEDITVAIDHLQANGEPSAAALGRRLAQHSLEERLQLTCDPFWTSWHSFWDMPHPLRDELAHADLVVLKGDANYRRLVDDRHWPHTTPITGADAGFPRPYLLLRTLKAEVMLDLPPGRAESLTQEDPQWLINGKRGIIQLVEE